MTPIERLVARIMQVVETSPGQVVTVSIVVDAEGDPICWQVVVAKAEGLKEIPKT